MATHQLIPLSVKEELVIMHESVPHLRKCRYLMWSVYNTIREVDNGLEKFLRVLCDLPVGRKLAVDYHKKTHWCGIASKIILKLVEPNWYELLRKMYCDGSYSIDSIAHRESNQPELISIDEKDEEFTILLEAQTSASTLNNEISMWSKNDEKINGKIGPLLCVRVADVTAQGTYKYDVGRNTHSLFKVHVNCLMDNHRSNFEERYEHCNFSTVDKNAWPQVSQNTYINLAVIKTQECQNPSTFTSETIRGDADDIHRVKGEINYKDAFDGINHGEVVIVEGRPGSGKTTLVHKISQDWAKLNAKSSISKGKEKHLNWSHIKALFLIHLRGFCGDPSIELIDLVKRYFSNRKTIEAICDYITLKEGAGICIILDGLDEYQPTNEDNFIFRLIEKTVLPNAVIIVASRPAAVAIYRTTKKHIEVLGFFKEQISEYIDSYNFSRDPVHSKSKLKHYLKERPNVYHMCYLPIQLAMICFLFTKMEGTLPDTETDIYEAFTKHTILRSLYRNSKNTEVFINSIFTMLEPNKHLFTKICALAFDKTLNSKQVLNQSEVELICDKISSAFGLVTIDRAATLCGFQNLYTFSHLTLQEFLAACHIFMVNGTDQLKLIEMSKERKHMVVVLKFLCGLISFGGQNGALFHKIINTKHINCLTKIQCAFESKSPATCNYLVKKNSLSIEGSFLTTRDWTAIGFVFMNTCENCVKKLNLIIPNISKESFEAFKIQTKQNSDSLILESISFSSSIDKIFIKFMRMFSSLSILTTKLNSTIKNMILFFKKKCHPNVTLIHFREHDIDKMILKFEFKKMLQGLVFSSVNSLKGSEDQTTCASALVDVILNSLEPQSEFFVEELREKCLAMCPSGSCAKLSIFDVDSDKSFMVAESFLIDKIAREITYMTIRISKLMNDSMLCHIDFIPAGGYVIALCLEVTHYNIAGRILIVPAEVSPFIENPDLINYNVLTVDDRFADKVRNYLEPLLLNNLVFYPNRILKNLHICKSYKISYPLSCILSIFHLFTTHLKEGSVKKLIDDLFHLRSALMSCTKLKETEVFFYGIDQLLSSLITKKTEYLGSKESNFTSIKIIKNTIKIEKVTLSTKAIDESPYHLECTSSSMKLTPYKSISIFVNRQILNLIQFQSDQLPIKIILKFDFVRLLNMYTIFSLNNFISKKSKSMDSILVDIILSCCNTKMENFVDELTELCSILCARSSCVRLSLAENDISGEIHLIAEGLDDKYIMIREIESIMSEILSIENYLVNPLFYINFIPVNGCLILLHCCITNSETKYGIYILPENFLSLHQNKLEELGHFMYKRFGNIVQDALKQILKTPPFTSKQKQLHYLTLDLYFPIFDYIPLVEIITEIDCHCKLEGTLPAIEQTNPSCINLISFNIPNSYEDCYVFCKLLELRFRDHLNPMNFPTNYELGINIDDLESLSNALRLCRKLKGNALCDGGEHFLFILWAGLKHYSDRDCKKIVEVDQVIISCWNRHDYNLIHSSSLVELSCSKNDIVSTISIFKYQNMKIFRFKSGPQPIKLIVKFNVSYLLKPLFSSSINFVEGKPESCTSYLANVILSSFNIQNNVDELTKLCSTMGQQDSCVKLSMMENTISDEIHMMAECMDRTDTIREIELITSSDLHREYSTRKIPLLHYTDIISVDGYGIIYYFDSTESSVVDYVMYIAPAEVINCIDHGVSGNELRLDSVFMSEVHYFMTQLFEDPLISQQQKQQLSLYISNNNSQPYPISQIITHFNTSLKHLELAGDCIAKHDLQELCQVMTSCNNLTSFSISGDEERYASDILASLKSCKKLNQVSLKKCYFNWARELAVSHIDQLNLVRLDLSENVMSIPFLKELAKHLKQWKMLQEISLSHCGISGESLAYLAEGLMKCKRLLALNISHNKLGNEGCMKLFGALCRLSQCNNVTLQRLDFSHCDISDKEVKALVDLIKEVSINLKVLDISHNDISSLAALKLFFALQSCINLLELSLRVKDYPAEHRQLLFYNSLKGILVKAVRLHKFSLSGLCFKDTTLFEQIKKLKNLQVLKLTNCRVETDCQFHSFVPESLRVLVLNNNRYKKRTLFYKHLQSHFSYCVHETVFLKFYMQVQ